ncbi:DUF1194 domain-containing protein [Aestuariivita boseongensis]|uniref:DUF1194 domain-containing protein n=1 Tax=Aestuariivita boseongensis TaxID=1470562 RepID=UPI0009E4888A|nr:DUF1194 domain-containing protein [Aestuariivita boseongensis]
MPDPVSHGKRVTHPQTGSAIAAGLFRLGCITLALALAGTLPSAASAQCRQALALGLDVSGSIDTGEYRLQMDGLAAALLHPEVLSSLLAMPSAPVALSVYEWSGPRDQNVLVNWTAIRDRSDVERIARVLNSAARPGGSVGTALGTAMRTGHDLLMQRPDCWKRTLDISGDGKRNLGPRPREVKPELERAGITVNALVIGADAPRLGDIRLMDIAELSSYFRANVIVGPDAFVQTALGFEDYENAMVQKLKRELEGLVLGRLEPTRQSGR